jgi:hypothetical protein
MESKVCIICNEDKLVNEYYNHPQMKDGKINKCKSCCKTQSKSRNIELSKDPKWVIKERYRNREKYHRLGYIEKQKEWNVKHEWKSNNKYKGLRRWYERRHGVLDPFIELHHWSYKDENLRDVILLSRSIHKKLHSELELIYSERCYKTSDGKILDTRKKHEAFINEFIKSRFSN